MFTQLLKLYLRRLLFYLCSNLRYHHFVSCVVSAVDAHVGARIFNEAICGVLRDKTRILVTHGVQYVTHADAVVVMQNGTIAERVSVYKDFLWIPLLYVAFLWSCADVLCAHVRGLSLNWLHDLIHCSLRWLQPMNQRLRTRTMTLRCVFFAH